MGVEDRFPRSVVSKDIGCARKEIPPTNNNMKMKSQTPVLSIAALAMIVGAVNAAAAAVIYEPFSQSTRSIDGRPGGDGLSGNWTSSGAGLASPSLAYGSPTELATAGNKLSFSSGRFATVGVGTGLSTGGLLANGSTLWFSFLLDPDDLSSTNDNAGFAFGTQSVSADDGIPMADSALDPGNGVGVSWDNGARLHASQWTSGTRATNGTTSTISLTMVTLVVGSITWGATDGDNEVIKIYLPGNDLLQPTALEAYSIAAKTQSDFDTISFARKGETDERDFLDEIRFGASYGEVLAIPEPSAALLGGLGLLALLRRRR